MVHVSPTGALIWREMRGTLWRRRTLGIVVVWLLCAFLVPYALWPDATMPPQAMGAQARMIVLGLCLVVFVGVGLTVPAIAAASLTSEREEDSLDLLRLTLLSNSGLVRGKALASALFSIVMVIGLFPVFSVVQFIVGLDAVQVLQLFVYLFLFSLMCGMGGVAFSALFRRTLVAIVAAYAGIALLLTGHGLPFVRLITMGYGYYLARGGGMSTWIISPLRVVTEIVSTGIPAQQFAVACAFPLTITAVAYTLAAWRVSRVTEPKHVPDEKPVDDRAVLKARRTQFPFYLIDPLRRKPAIADDQNAMVVREIRWGLFNKTTWMVRVFYGTFVVFIFPMLAASMPLQASPRVWMICMQIVTVVFSAPVLVGSAWTKERELGNIDMIRMTLLRALDLYVGKAAGGVAALAPMLAALFLTGAPVLIWHRGEAFILFCGYLTMANCAAIALSLCLFASVMACRTTTAIAWGVVLCGTLFFGAYAVSLVAVPNLHSAGNSVASPIMAYGTCFAWAERLGFRLQGGHFTGGPSPSPTLIWAIAQVVFAGIGGAIALATIWRMARREMRDP